MSDTVTIDVDGLPVEVDAEEYDADPEWVLRKVRGARAELRLDDDTAEADDYTSRVGDDS